MIFCLPSYPPHHLPTFQETLDWQLSWMRRQTQCPGMAVGPMVSWLRNVWRRMSSAKNLTCRLTATYCNFEVPISMESAQRLQLNFKNTFLASCSCCSCVLVLVFPVGFGPTGRYRQKCRTASKAALIYLECCRKTTNEAICLDIPSISQCALCGTDCGHGSLQAMSDPYASKRNNIAAIEKL